MTKFLIRYRNPILFALLVVTMLVSALIRQEHLAVETSTVALPMVHTTASPMGRLQTFRQQREDTALADMASLQALCDAPGLAAPTREDAAARLRELVDTREKQAALECALAECAVSPCVAVLTPGCVTIVTDRTDLTDAQRAQVLSLARAHTGVEPSGIRLICGNE